ncbi:hypothetical protein, partial [Bradyrhizobium elkanii]|uniref:hypothetical protein n=1 Tax=Bradyrhizobium elkanii TaxID=29448 RepID=UPI001AEC00FB
MRPVDAISSCSSHAAWASRSKDALGDDVGRREYLIALLVKRQLTVAEVRPGPERASRVASGERSCILPRPIESFAVMIPS